MEQSTIAGFRLSPTQKQRWSWQQHQTSSAYYAYGIIEIKGELHPPRLITAIKQVVAQNEILHTTFLQLPGMDFPLQAVGNPQNITISQHDLSHLSPDEQSDQLTTIISNSHNTPFNYEQGPLLTANLIQLAPQHHTLHLYTSPLCADTETLTLLLHQIVLTYTGTQSTPDEEALQFIDLSEWLNDLLLSEESEIGKTYWQNQNLTALTTQLPWTQSTTAEFAPKHLTYPLDTQLQTTIDNFLQTTDASRATFLLAAWRLLLMRLTNQPDITIGRLHNGRHYDELKEALGPLAQYLPISHTITADQSFHDLLTHTQTADSATSEWQECFSWEQLSTPSTYLPFCFTYHSPFPTHTDANTTFILQHAVTHAAPFHIQLSCQPQPDNTLHLTFYYDAHRLTHDDVQRLAEQYNTLLAAAVAQPETAVTRLNILPSTQQNSLQHTNNQTQKQFNIPENACFHHLFEAQVTRTPTAPAITVAQNTLTYTQLNQQANQLAHHLQNIGMTPDTPIAFCLDRSLDTLITILAIFKAGAAYLPLDPTLPSERLNYMLQDSQAPILITDTIHQSLIKNQKLKILCLDALPLNELPTHSPNTPLSPQNLAYIIYTSGSTGQPKGVAIPHSALVNYVCAIQDRLQFPANAHFATVSTFAADLGHTAVFPPLVNGGCLHIIPTDHIADPQKIAAYYQQHPIDILKIVPSHIAALLSSDTTSTILPRHQLILGGEATHWELIQTLQESSPTCHIINHYGPTETTVGVLANPTPTEEDKQWAATLPLGRPLANTQIYCLDPHLQLVPAGVTGQLYISGNNLARGYWQRPSQTADRFIPNPFASSPTAATSRLYRTGDLVRLLPNGNIEFLGRVDHQIKLRGYRIELGEIETALQQHPAIQRAVATITESETTKYLTAYLASSQKPTPTPEQCREHLSQSLPAYMIPHHFIILDKLPLTSNGKVDRRALPHPDTLLTRSQAYVPPTTAIEIALARIWQQLLSQEKVGIHDNFFELGGHSLLATQLISRIRSSFRVELPLPAIFRAPTVAGLIPAIIQHEPKPGQVEKIAHMLNRVDSMSDEEAQALLQQKKQTKTT